MEYRQLGTSDVKISVITLGSWAIGGWMWGRPDDDSAIAAIAESIDLGVTSIDTAPVYGYGHSETVVGKAVAGRRDKVQILTKYVLRWDCDEGDVHFEWTDADGVTKQIRVNGRKESVIWECEQSLKRLGTDYIDLYQCHWPDPSTPVEETMGAIDKLLADGKIRAAGVSNWSGDEIGAACKIVPLASNQPPYSMINRKAEADVMSYCAQHNIATIVYSPLQRGLLTGKVTMERVFPKADHRAANPFFTPDNRKKVLEFLDEIRPIAEGHNVTLAQLAINWTINRAPVTAALVGARNPQQARENAAAAEFKLAEAETKRIDELIAERFGVGWETA